MPGVGGEVNEPPVAVARGATGRHVNDVGGLEVPADEP